VAVLAVSYALAAVIGSVLPGGSIRSRRLCVASSTRSEFECRNETAVYLDRRLKESETNSRMEADQSHDPRTVESYVRETLRNAILRGEFAVGSRLIQAQIARDLQVSTTPVREALRSLATEGLIALDPHRGAVVRELSTEEVHDVHVLRTLLEPEVMRRAVARITPEQIAEAETIQAQMVDEADPGRWSDLNRRFHRVFLEASGSERLAQMVGSLHDSYAPYIVTMMMDSPQTMAASALEHEEMLEAVRRGDAEAAIASVLHHMRKTVEHADEVEGSAITGALGSVEGNR
jgi:DNA-binding GntR family transcriptional regulator